MAHPTLIGLDTFPMSHAMDVSIVYSLSAHYFFLISYAEESYDTGASYFPDKRNGCF